MNTPANDNHKTLRHGQMIKIDDLVAGSEATYVVAFDDYVKIGSTANPRRRFAALQSGVPTYLNYCALFYGGESVESALHKRFRDHSTGFGEWFRYEGSLKQWMESGCPDELVSDAIHQRRLEHERRVA